MALVSDRRYQYALIFCVGTVLQCWLLSRAWIGCDQVALLALGEHFARTGELSVAAKGMSGGGMIPGSLLQILIGLPLKFLQHFRSPNVVLALFGLLSALPLYLVTRGLGRFGLIYFAMYWLSPWRIYHAGVLWEPAYLFLPAILHLWCFWKLKDGISFTHSLILGAIFTVLPQLHGSFLIIWLLTLGLLAFKKMRLSILAFCVGLLLGSITLIPYLNAILNGTAPSSLPLNDYIGKSLVQVAPVLKGLLYWPRLGSLDIGVPLQQLIFLEDWEASPGITMIVVVLIRAMQAIGFITIVGAATAAWWMYKRRKTVRLSQLPKDAAIENWIWDYGLISLVALLIASALSPVTLQGWHVILVLHAAILPVAWWVDNAVLRWRRGRVLLTTYLVSGIIGNPDRFGQANFPAVRLSSRVKRSSRVRASHSALSQES